MIAMLLFSGAAALLVFLAGRNDKARDPRLTVLALILLVVFPVLLAVLPKFAVLPAPVASVNRSGFPWMNILLLAWGAGFLTMALRFGFAALGISKWRRRSLLLDQLAGVEIRQLSGLKGPVAAGVIRPVVFVPEEWHQWPDETRRIVLDHELAHHRRRDPLWRWIAGIACVIHGGNPLVIWMVRRLTIQCEFACDAMVLEKGVAVRDYANLLCDFAEARPPSGPVLAMAASSSLESRVRRLLSPRPPKGAAGLVVLSVLVLTLAAALPMFGSAKIAPAPVSRDEVRMRWAADPFPGETLVSDATGR
jgi:beta-lactamase regulating signal transducer with metallopeptidase domain